MVDINQAPIPLAFAVVDANRPLYSRDEGRRLQEEARIASQMELGYPCRQADISKASFRGVEMSDNAYIGALRISLSRYRSGRTVRDPGYSGAACAFNLEYCAAERTLQVSIEACIGVAKHWGQKRWRRPYPTGCLPGIRNPWPSVASYPPTR